MHTFSSFSSFRDVKPSLRACFLKLCSCAMFACGYAVLARDRTHFLDSTSCCLFVEWWDFAWLRHVFPIAPCFCRCTRCTVFLYMRHYFVCFQIAPKNLGARLSGYNILFQGWKMKINWTILTTLFLFNHKRYQRHILHQTNWHVYKRYCREKNKNATHIQKQHGSYCWWFRNPAITTWDVAKTRRK